MSVTVFCLVSRTGLHDIGTKLYCDIFVSYYLLQYILKFTASLCSAGFSLKYDDDDKLSDKVEYTDLEAAAF